MCFTHFLIQLSEQRYEIGTLSIHLTAKDTESQGSLAKFTHLSRNRTFKTQNQQNKSASHKITQDAHLVLAKSRQVISWQERDNSQRNATVEELRWAEVPVKSGRMSLRRHLYMCIATRNTESIFSQIYDLTQSHNVLQVGWRPVDRYCPLTEKTLRFRVVTQVALIPTSRLLQQ